MTNTDTPQTGTIKWALSNEEHLKTKAQIQAIPEPILREAHEVLYRKLCGLPPLSCTIPEGMIVRSAPAPSIAAAFPTRKA